MKIELVLTVWDDGVFKLRDRIEADNTDSIVEEFGLMIDKVVEKLVEMEQKRYAIAEDDDIPF